MSKNPKTHEPAQAQPDTRWLRKKDGNVVLQQLYLVDPMGNNTRDEWRDVPTVSE